MGLVLEKTPFYAESGGQVGDQGMIQNKDNIFIVTDTKKAGQQIVHYGHIKKGTFDTGMSVMATVDKDLRQKTVLNHTATHLLQPWLKK